MSPPFNHNATFQDEATGPQPNYLRAYGPFIPPFQVENATPDLAFDYNPEQQFTWDNMMVPSYQTGPPSAGSPFTIPGAHGQFVFDWPLAPTAATQCVALPDDNGCGLDHPSPFAPLSPPSRTTTTTSSVALAPADMMSSEILSELHNWSDERLIDILARLLIHPQALPIQLVREVNYRLQGQRGPPEPDLRAQLRGWGVECEGPSSTNGINPGQRKRRRDIEDDETGDRAVAQRGKTQELPVRRTLAREFNKSKPGHRALEMEPLVAPPQGVLPTLSPGPIVTGATPGSLERDQAWTEGRGRIIEDRHEEEETDRERWGRLMKREDGVWKCMGCGGKRFSDRSTLQRHCKSLAHSKKRDMRKCRYCEKKFPRSSSVKRHEMAKHPQVDDGAM
ncbi:hypothetical protein BC827DRAFT_1152842 [Russula dissimulans]|nr:hypothetical protein BC827DRAFT_1152842 [Russula dissimulans]